MKEADDRALARKANKEAAEEAARDKSFATLYNAAQAAISKPCLHAIPAGDSKKGANLFKVIQQNTICTSFDLTLFRQDAPSAIPSSSPKATRSVLTFTVSLVARLVK